MNDAQNFNQNLAETLPPDLAKNLPALDSFDYNSPRAKIARLGKIFSNTATKIFLALAIIILATLGGYLLCTGVAACWLLFALVFVAIIFLILSCTIFTRVPDGKSENINDVLSTNVLRILPKNPTPKQAAAKLFETRSGRFLAMRFGIIERLLTALASENQSDMNKVFATAQNIRKELNVKLISGGILAIAIIENYPGYEDVLARMKLEIKDLYEGLNWYDHLHGLIKNSNKKRHDGGIARDFTFGFTPMLSRYGKNLGAYKNLAYKTQIFRSAHNDALKQMIEIFEKSGRQNVALIGPDGSGKSTLVNAFSEILLDANSGLKPNLKFRQVFELDAGTILSLTNGQGDVERVVTRIINEAYTAKNVILFFDNAHLFFEDGVGSVNISNLLLPILQAGNLRVILAMDDSRFQQIALQNPSLANALNKIIITPTNREETLKVLEDKAPWLEAESGVVYSWWALTETYRLSDRYVQDLEMPGKAVKLLSDAGRFAKNGIVFGESVKTAIEQTTGVKLDSITSDEESKTRLLNLEDLIHERMVDQVPAVKAVSSALRRAGAGVRNQNRPIGTFLFLGPTGVGKTELAKTISKVYFEHGNDNTASDIVRIDMNEYTAPTDVARLVQPADENPNSLVAEVRKNPFTVVLFDEIEKASNEVQAALLQLLDEGVLRDSNNKETSFRDTIVIATSNAGVDKIREKIAAGETDFVKMKDELTNHLIDTREFKPEFLNRFDEICIFKPLSEEDLLKITDILLANVNKTLLPQKITVTLTDEAKRLLAHEGYDPQLGARPLQRVIQKSVENIIAKARLSGAIDTGSSLTISADDVRAELAS